MEEVEQLIRKHETFQKVLTAQDEKVMGSGSPGQPAWAEFVGGREGVWVLRRVLNGRCEVLGVYPETVLMSGG